MGAITWFRSRILKKSKKLKSNDSSVDSSVGASSSEPSQSPALTSSSTVKILGEGDLKKVFDKFDMDGNGEISINELQSMLQAFGAPDPDSEAKSIMNVVDLNCDGCIGFDEFSVVIQKDVDEGKCLDDVRQAFAMYDRDGNGLISASELHWVMREVVGEKTTLEECKKMIRGVDRDGDGNVCFEEFVNMMSHSLT